MFSISCAINEFLLKTEPWVVEGGFVGASLQALRLVLVRDCGRLHARGAQARLVGGASKNDSHAWGDQQLVRSPRSLNFARVECVSGVNRVRRGAKRAQPAGAHQWNRRQPQTT